MGTTVPIAITIMFTHIFVTCDKFIIMYTCMYCVEAAMHYSTTHNINRRAQCQSERNELLAQVAKRAERAQLLVIVKSIVRDNLARYGELKCTQ